MTISQRIFFLMEKQGKKQKELSNFTGISTSTISAWNKRGTNPAADTISIIADFLEVSTDFLLTGMERSEKANISNSTIGAFGSHSYGTVTMSTGLTATETKSKPTGNPEQDMSDITKEIVKISESLPMKEQVRLLNMIYDFEEEYKKSTT
ncbi:MAG: helix-turn-helix domain-containing protein [Ruminococcus sp.]|nr:helix-turn-helix domain-containing protein [Ruminococcus sp.]